MQFTDKALAQVLDELLQNAEYPVTGDGAPLDALYGEDPDEGEQCEATVVNTRSYDEAGILTSDAGLLVRLSDGSQFAITVQPYRGWSV